MDDREYDAAVDDDAAYGGSDINVIRRFNNSAADFVDLFQRVEARVARLEKLIAQLDRSLAQKVKDQAKLVEAGITINVAEQVTDVRDAAAKGVEQCRAILNQIETARLTADQIQARSDVRTMMLAITTSLMSAAIVVFFMR